MPRDLYIKAFRINHRFENWWGRSEYTITHQKVDQYGNADGIQNSQTLRFEQFRKIADVHRNDINKQHNRNIKWFDSGNGYDRMLPSGTHAIIWATYERDWISTDKELGYACHNGTTVYLSGNRTNTADWYSYNPFEEDNNPQFCPTNDATIDEARFGLYTTANWYIRYTSQLNRGYIDTQWQ